MSVLAMIPWCFVYCSFQLWSEVKERLDISTSIWRKRQWKKVEREWDGERMRISLISNRKYSTGRSSVLQIYLICWIMESKARIIWVQKKTIIFINNYIIIILCIRHYLSVYSSQDTNIIGPPNGAWGKLERYYLHFKHKGKNLRHVASIWNYRPNTAKIN